MIMFEIYDPVGRPAILAWLGGIPNYMHMAVVAEPVRATLPRDFG